jgi:hypothetical protein
MMRKITDGIRRLNSGRVAAMAFAVLLGSGAPAAAADLSLPEQPVVAACPPPQEVVILYDKEGRPTVPGGRNTISA